MVGFGDAVSWNTQDITVTVVSLDSSTQTASQMAARDSTLQSLVSYDC
jgi:hypothetical protein